MSRLVGEYFAEIAEGAPDSFKAKAKETLKERIASAVTEIKDEPAFKAFSPAYAEWAKGVVEQLKGGKRDAEQPATENGTEKEEAEMEDADASTTQAD